ncbi:MAG: T9SS type A sorting domain-containing protein [Ignavibacteriota bacterium]
MQRPISIFILFLLFVLSDISLAQRVQVDITLDPLYGTSGRTEVNLGGFSNEAMVFEITRDSRVTTVFSRVSTAAAGAYKVGAVRVDSNGTLDPRFGIDGTGLYSWGESDYPLGLIRHSNVDSMYVISGATGIGANTKPALYRFKKDGTPDSTFGADGKLITQFDDLSGGEAVSVSTSGTHYTAVGKSLAADPNGKTGFGVLSVNWDGSPDTSLSELGYKSRFVLPALVHSVQGMLLNNQRIFMCGISDTGKRELLIARFTEKRVPDSAVGINGLIHTGIILKGDTIWAALQGDNKVVLLLPTGPENPTHLTIRRYNEFGIPDSTYGINGEGNNDIQPNFTPKGFFLSSDFSEIVSGITPSAAGNSIYVRISDTTSVPDPTFNGNGVISIDVDGGTFPNYLKFVQPIGKLDQFGNIKRFIGVGGSIHNGVEHVMIARFIGHPSNGVEENTSEKLSLKIYPDPVSKQFRVVAGNPELKNVRIVDVLGREVCRLRLESTSDNSASFSGDGSAMPNGTYFVVASDAGKIVLQRFVVSH